jgi:hypothetical protein
VPFKTELHNFVLQYSDWNARAPKVNRKKRNELSDTDGWVN